MIAALGGIAWALSDSPKVGAWFAFLFTVALAGPAYPRRRHALRALRFLLNRTRLHLPSSLRHGLANLYRPGNQSAAVLAALGTGVMLILAVYLMQKDLLRDLRETASPKLPNVFLVDVRSEEVAGVKAFFAHQAGRQPATDLMPVVMGRFISINGQPVDQMKGQHYPRSHAGERGTDMGRCAARGRQSDRGRVVDEQQCGRDRDRRWRGASACTSAWVLLWNLRPAERRARSKSPPSIAPTASTWARACRSFCLRD